MELADRVAIMERGPDRADRRAGERCWPPPPIPSSPASSAMRRGWRARCGTACCGFGALPLPPLRVALPDGRPPPILRPRRGGGAPGGRAAAWCSLIRATAEGELRLVVEAGGMALDAVLGCGRAGLAGARRALPAAHRAPRRSSARTARGRWAGRWRRAGRLPGRDRGGLIPWPSRKGRRKRRCRIAAPCWRACLRPGARVACFPGPRAPNPAAMERPACPPDRLRTRPDRRPARRHQHGQFPAGHRQQRRPAIPRASRPTWRARSPTRLGVPVTYVPYQAPGRAGRRGGHRRLGHRPDRRRAAARREDRLHRRLCRDRGDLSGAGRLADQQHRRGRPAGRAHRGDGAQRLRPLAGAQHQAGPAGAVGAASTPPSSSSSPTSSMRWPACGRGC